MALTSRTAGLDRARATRTASRDERGDIAAEYGFLIVLIALALTIALSALGTTFSTWLSDAADFIRP